MCGDVFDGLSFFFFFSFFSVHFCQICKGKFHLGFVYGSVSFVLNYFAYQTDFFLCHNWCHKTCFGVAMFTLSAEDLEGKFLFIYLFIHFILSFIYLFFGIGSLTFIDLLFVTRRDD